MFCKKNHLCVLYFLKSSEFVFSFKLSLSSICKILNDYLCRYVYGFFLECNLIFRRAYFLFYFSPRSYVMLDYRYLCRLLCPFSHSRVGTASSFICFSSFSSPFILFILSSVSSDSPSWFVASFNNIVVGKEFLHLKKIPFMPGHPLSCLPPRINSLRLFSLDLLPIEFAWSSHMFCLHWDSDH